MADCGETRHVKRRMPSQASIPGRVSWFPAKRGGVRCRRARFLWNKYTMTFALNCFDLPEQVCHCASATLLTVFFAGLLGDDWQRLLPFSMSAGCEAGCCTFLDAAPIDTFPRLMWTL